MLVVLANAHPARRTSRQAMAEPNPVPPATKDDAEDVSWALSTAEAMWMRGDKDDAVKWIRRAVESAAEVGADDRALELAKAAADLASYVGPAPTAPAPQPAALVVAVKPAAPMPAAPRPATAVAVTPRAPAAVRSPSPPVRPAAGAPPLKPAAAAAPQTPRASPAGEAGRGVKARPAPPPIMLDNEVTQEVRVPPAWEAQRRAPAAAAATPAAPAVERVTDEIDAWPTQSLRGADIDNEQDELTRIGEPAYAAGTVNFAAEAPAKPSSDDLHPSQAVRVVVWRSADGVHVAPHGTTVNAIVVEAMLVALDPAADLAAWLARR
jgi:hypothetical protein